MFARTETAWFHDLVWPRMTGALFLAGRLTFHWRDGSKGESNAGGPSVLVAYGEPAFDRLAWAVSEGLVRGRLVR